MKIKINKNIALMVTFIILLLSFVPYSLAYGEIVSGGNNPENWMIAFHERFVFTDSQECVTIAGQENFYSGISFAYTHVGALENINCDGSSNWPIKEEYWSAVTWKDFGGSDYKSGCPFSKSPPTVDSEDFYEAYVTWAPMESPVPCYEYGAWTLPPFVVAMCYTDCNSDGIFEYTEDFGSADPVTGDLSNYIQYPASGHMMYRCDYPSTGTYTRTFGCVVFKNPAYTDTEDLGFYGFEALHGTPYVAGYPSIQAIKPTNTWSNILPSTFGPIDCAGASDALSNFWFGSNWINVDFCTIEAKKTFNVYIEDGVTIINETVDPMTQVNTSDPSGSWEHLDFTSLKPWSKMSDRKQAKIINQMEASNLFIDIIDILLTIVEIIFSIIVLLFYILEISVMIYVLIVWVPGFFRKVLGLIDHINGLMRGVR